MLTRFHFYSMVDIKAKQVFFVRLTGQTYLPTISCHELTRVKPIQRHGELARIHRPASVSYTHLDVYKRQVLSRLIALKLYRVDRTRSGGKLY